MRAVRSFSMERMMKSNIIDIDVEVTARTEKAVLVHTGIKEKAVWLPLSQIEIEDSAIAGIETVSLPEWLALDKGLI
jgi:hypothetical protein